MGFEELSYVRFLNGRITAFTKRKELEILFRRTDMDFLISIFGSSRFFSKFSSETLQLDLVWL